MKRTNNKQAAKTLDPIEVFVDARRLGRKQKWFAKRIRRTPQAVSKAFQGRLPTVLRKIQRIIEQEKARKGLTNSYRPRRSRS